MTCIVSSAWVNSLGTVGLFVSPFAIISCMKRLAWGLRHATTVLNVASDIDLWAYRVLWGKVPPVEHHAPTSSAPARTGHTLFGWRRGHPVLTPGGRWTQVRADLLECARRYRAWRGKTRQAYSACPDWPFVIKRTAEQICSREKLIASNLGSNNEGYYR